MEGLRYARKEEMKEGRKKCKKWIKKCRKKERQDGVANKKDGS